MLRRSKLMTNGAIFKLRPKRSSEGKVCMGCRMGKKENKNAEQMDEVMEKLADLDIPTLSRKDLQSFCKQFGLKANGKTSELINRLQSHITKQGDNGLVHTDNNNNLSTKVDESQKHEDGSQASRQVPAKRKRRNQDKKKSEEPPEYEVVDGDSSQSSNTFSGPSSISEPSESSHADKRNRSGELTQSQNDNKERKRQRKEVGKSVESDNNDNKGGRSRQIKKIKKDHSEPKQSHTEEECDNEVCKTSAKAETKRTGRQSKKPKQAKSAKQNMSSAQSENPEANKLDSKEVDLCVKDSDQMNVSTGNSRSCESVESANVCGDAVDDTSRAPGNQCEVIVADDVCFETSTSSGCDLSSTEPTTGVKDAANRTFTIPRTVENTVNETGKVENDCVQSSSEVLQSQDVTSSLQWCVAHGAIRSFNKLTWKLIRLKGGRPVVPNRFGKYIPFTLTPSQLIVPTGFQDNFICEECVRSNETISNVECEQEVKENVTPLTGISRESIRASIKRKREEEMGGTGSEEVNAENKRRRKSVPRSAGTSPLTPASPDIRKARGETLALPRNLSKPWQPKKRSPGVSTTVQEDQNFAKKVEDIIRNVVPGSDEELLLIMGKKSHVSHSPPRA